jgi:hypothetical protein
LPKWERLLFTSGGKLEIEKCAFALFNWNFDDHGRANLDSSTRYNLHIQSSETKEVTLIPQISTTKAYKYVGVQLALDGNMQRQIEDLRIKCIQMAVIFKQTYFKLYDAKQGFVTVYSPSVKYPLPTTSISKSTLQQIQKPVIHAVLSRMGFNNHFPRSMVFASTRYGGLGLVDLYSEQSVGQIQLLVTHLRSNSYISNTIFTLLESFQVTSGILGNPLENLIPTQYISSACLLSIRYFLSELEGQIKIPTLKTFQKMTGALWRLLSMPDTNVQTLNG